MTGNTDIKRSEITREVLENVLTKIRLGEVDHGLSIAQMLLSEGPNFDPALLLEIIEGILELSSVAGSTETREYLDDQWPTLKKNHLRRLSNKAKKRESL